MASSAHLISATPRELRALRWLFGAAVVFLVVQFAVAQRSEPYPAVILPAGPSLYHATPGAVEYDVRILLACDTSGACTEVDGAEILGEFGSSTYGAILNNRFGLRREGPDATRSATIGPIRLRVFNYRTTPAEVERTRAWLRGRVERLAGHSVARLDYERRRYRWALDGDVAPQLIGAEVTESLDLSAPRP